jgi:hypothetical protein
MSLHTVHFGIRKYFVGKGELSSVPVVALSDFRPQKRTFLEVEESVPAIEQGPRNEGTTSCKLYNFFKVGSLKKRGKYRVYPEDMKLRIGRYAAMYGITASVKRFQGEFNGEGIPRNSSKLFVATIHSNILVRDIRYKQVNNVMTKKRMGRPPTIPVYILQELKKLITVTFCGDTCHLTITLGSP